MSEDRGSGGDPFDAARTVPGGKVATRDPWDDPDFPKIITLPDGRQAVNPELIVPGRAVPGVEAPRENANRAKTVGGQSIEPFTVTKDRSGLNSGTIRFDPSRAPGR